MNLEALKEKARRHEQKEEWKKALDAYRQVIQKQDKDEPPDITLFNRIGDIQTRLGLLDSAVESYEKAVDLYLEAELPNNAIAICKKVIRNLPERSVFFLRMGQIRGAQGFLTDAKQNFLTYAERQTAVGALDSAMDALVELVDLAPDDVEIRTGLASQLESHDRMEEAVAQYMEAYRHLLLQDRVEEAEALAEQIQTLAPGTELPDLDAIQDSLLEDSLGGSSSNELGFGGFELGSGVRGGDLSPGEVEFLDVGDGAAEPTVGSPAEEEGEREGPLAPAREAGESDSEGGGIGDSSTRGVGKRGVPGLPTLSFGGEAEGEEDPDAPPTFGLKGGDDEEVEFGSDGPLGGYSEAEDAEPLPTLGEPQDEGEPESLPGFDLPEDELAEVLPTFSEMNQEEAAEALSLLDAPPEEEDLPFLATPEDEVDQLPAVPASPVGESALGEKVSGSLEDQAFEHRVEELQEEAPAPREPASAHAEAADRGDFELAIELVRAEIEESPDDVDLYQRQVEYAFRTGDNAVLVPAYVDLANHLLMIGATQKAKAVFQQVLSLAPGEEAALAGIQQIDGVDVETAPPEVASSEEYVDLGSMILGEEAEKTTRWQVMADSPTGDDQADFAKMLNQFKEKVSENVDADDLSAHHDLGTAYLEMGLLDEAISEFQMALRASPDHLPTHEVMGRCWMEKGAPDMAVRALNRALDANFEVEDELIGIYYIMGIAKEELGKVDEAVEFFEKVFSLDINFKDVTERLRALR